MRIVFLYLFFVLPLFSKTKEEIIFHKTIGKIEVYKDKGTLNLPVGCVKRLSKNLLTPIHTRDLILKNKTEKHLVTKTHKGPFTVTFLLPLSMKRTILELLAKNHITLSIPYDNNKSIVTKNLEIDRYATPPLGLFAMRSIIETDALTPSELIFIHLLRDEI